MTLLATLGKVVAFVVLMLVAGARLLPWLLECVVRTGSRELFTLAVVTIAVGVAFASAELFGVSFALGAFFAGLVVNESDHSRSAPQTRRGLAGAICFFAVGVKFRFGYDDSLNVVGVHCVGCITGALLTGVFASKLINPAGADGLLNGNPSQLLIQLIAVGASVVFAFAGSLILLKIVDAMVGLRVADDEEQMGLDLTSKRE